MMMVMYEDGMLAIDDGPDGCGSVDGTKEIVTVVAGPLKTVTGEAMAEIGTVDGISSQEITTMLGDEGTVT